MVWQNRINSKKPCNLNDCRVFCGGDKRDRTADLLNAIQTLSQLSYTPILMLTVPISRVLSRVVIYLCCTLPYSSGAKAPRHRRSCVGQTSWPFTVLLRIGFTGNDSCQPFRWALTSPFHPYSCSLTKCQRTCCGLFLLHFPWSRLRRTLSVILPYEARTFLTARPFGMLPRDNSALSDSIIHKVA